MAVLERVTRGEYVNFGAGYTILEPRSEKTPVVHADADDSRPSIVWRSASVEDARRWTKLYSGIAERTGTFTAETIDPAHAIGVHLTGDVGSTAFTAALMKEIGAAVGAELDVKPASKRINAGSTSVAGRLP